MKLNNKYMLSLLLYLTLIKATELPSFYHRTWEMLEYLQSLKCKNLSHISSDNIHVFRISSSSTCKSFLLFGEHPRELISSELAFYFIKEICSGNLNSADFSDILIVLNANPQSRAETELGDFCKRTNPSNVDINRNWGGFWKPTDCTSDSEVCSGPNEFSENETVEIRRLLEDFNPDLFLSIHSGKNAMIYPYAYGFSPINEEDSQKFLKILNSINTEYRLNAEIGEASKVLEYLAPGNCADYAYSILNIPYVFAWEIYEEQQEYRSFLQEKHTNFLQVTRKLTPSDCFSYFNPTTAADYSAVLQKWSQALAKTIVLTCS